MPVEIKLSPNIPLQLAQWRAEAVKRFGPDPRLWQFVCPVCKHVASVKDWEDAGATEGEVAFSCVGRHIAGSREAFGRLGVGPCDYAGGGLFRLNPQEVVDEDGKTHHVFAFAEALDAS
jgi:hypothetical protein